jgi:hypothetical protein
MHQHHYKIATDEEYNVEDTKRAFFQSPQHQAQQQ